MDIESFSGTGFVFVHWRYASAAFIKKSLHRTSSMLDIHLFRINTCSIGDLEMQRYLRLCGEHVDVTFPLEASLRSHYHYWPRDGCVSLLFFDALGG